MGFRNSFSFFFCINATHLDVLSVLSDELHTQICSLSEHDLVMDSGSM